MQLFLYCAFCSAFPQSKKLVNFDFKFSCTNITQSTPTEEKPKGIFVKVFSILFHQGNYKGLFSLLYVDARDNSWRIATKKKKKEVKPGNKHKNYKTKSQPQGHLTLKSSTFSSETREASHFRVRSTPMEGASTVLKQSITHTTPVRTKAILFSKLHKHAQRNTPCTEILQSKKKASLLCPQKIANQPNHTNIIKEREKAPRMGYRNKELF